jgi:ATP-binding cassette subfamily B protein
MVLAYFGIQVSFDAVVNLLGNCRKRATAVDLIRAGAIYGLKGRGVRVEAEDVSCLPVASVLHWEYRHFIVLEGIKDNAVHIIDPSFGHRIMQMDQFSGSFSGVAILFHRGRRDSKRR